MVRGMESFREWFRGYEDCYAIVGEAACDLLQSERGLDSGTVKEIDLIPIGQEEDSSFWERFSGYVSAAGYEEAGSSVDVFAVCEKPLSGEYPKTIRLWRGETFDADYAALIRQERTAASGVSVLTVPALIALEAKAWLDLSERKEAGEEIRNREIEKHKDLAFSLTGLLPGGPKEPLQVPDSIRADMKEFLKRMEIENVSLRKLGIIGMTKEEVLEELNGVLFLKHLEFPSNRTKSCAKSVE